MFYLFIFKFIFGRTCYGTTVCPANGSNSYILLTIFNPFLWTLLKVWRFNPTTWMAMVWSGPYASLHNSVAHNIHHLTFKQYGTLYLGSCLCINLSTHNNIPNICSVDSLFIVWPMVVNINRISHAWKRCNLYAQPWNEAKTLRCLCKHIPWKVITHWTILQPQITISEFVTSQMASKTLNKSIGF